MRLEVDAGQLRDPVPRPRARLAPAIAVERALGFHSLPGLPCVGEVVAQAGDGEAIIAAEIDPGRVWSVRAEYPFLQDRR